MNVEALVIIQSSIRYLEKPFKWILLILSLMSLSKEIFQVVYDKWEYFFDVANYVEWALYICAILFLVDNGSETPEAKVSFKNNLAKTESPL